MKVFAIVCTSAMAAAVLAGCTQESSPGGPGVSRTPANPSNPSAAMKTTVSNKNDTFTLLVPKMNTDVNQGHKEDVTIAINRGKEFTQNVKLEFMAPKGISVTPAAPLIPAGKEKITVSIEAAKDAPKGKTQIQVKAVPESGTAVTMQMPVEIRAAS